MDHSARYTPRVSWPLLVVIGIGVGCLGTLIGAGGGFLLAPLLLIFYPELEPEQITAISLAVVFVNASVGSFSYWRKGRVDVRSALEFAAVAIPGAAIGLALNAIIPREGFAILLGALLIVGGGLLIMKPLPKRGGVEQATAPNGDGENAPRASTNDGHASSQVSSAWGPRFVYPRAIGLPLAGGVGILSSLLGIGGGIIHVPAMIHLLRFPVHNATATSHFVLALTAAAAFTAHVCLGSYEGHWRETIWIAAGVVVGSPIGAALSARLRGAIIVRALAGALVLVGVRVLWSVVKSKFSV